MTRKIVCFYNWGDWKSDITQGRIGHLGSNVKGSRLAAAADDANDPNNEVWLLTASKDQKWRVSAWLKVLPRKSAGPTSNAEWTALAYYDLDESKIIGNTNTWEREEIPEIDKILQKHKTLVQQGQAGFRFSEPKDRDQILKSMERFSGTSFRDWLSNDDSKNPIELPLVSSNIFPNENTSSIDGDKMSDSDIADGSSDSDTDQVTPSVNSEAPGSRRATSPEEDEERRKKQAENGARGEEIAMQYEVERLKGLYCPDPPRHIEHVSKTNNNAGYDIFSGWNEEETRYIEVKASEKGSDTFFISSNEVKELKRHGQKAWIYMIDLSKKDDCVTEIGSPGEKFDKEIKLEATQYRASLSGSSK